MNLKHIYQDMAQSRRTDDIEKMLCDVDAFISEVKHTNSDAYEKLKMDIYVLCYGYHFNEDMLYEAYETMKNDNGTLVPKFDLREAERIASQSGIRFTSFNVYDWAYVLNMFYSDYCQLLGDDTKMYARMAEKFLVDPDAPDGGATKALRYYVAMHPKK